MDSKWATAIGATALGAAGVFYLTRPASSPEASIWVCGEVLIDRLPGKDGGERLNVVGGGAANTAKALSRLGLPVQFIDGLSTDEYGVLAKADLLDDGVKLEMCPVLDQPTCLATVSVDGDGKASYEFLIEGTATFAFSSSWLPDPAAHKPAALHIGTLGTIIEPGAAVVLEWAGSAAKQGVPVVFDPNVRPSVVSDQHAYRQAVEQFAQISAVVKASDDDVNWLYPGTELLDVARRWLACESTRLVVITRGADGLMAVTRSEEAGEGYQVIYEPGVPIVVKDTVGAGDTVGAVLVEGVVRHGVAKLVDGSGTLRSVLNRANRASAITCSREGCKPPTQLDLE